MGAIDPIALERENEKLRKIVKVLVDRVERSTDAQGNAFSLFQAAITLETTVRQRTSELQNLNRQLQIEIAERREVEIELERARVQAERANISKTEFLSAASHDLLQPLSIARLFLDTVGELEHDERSATMLERVDRSLEAAEALLSALLEMSRIDAGALTPEISDVALDPLLRRLSDDYGMQAEELGLRLRVVPCDAIVRTDSRLLERILRNFLSNALRYTRSGGILLGVRRRGAALRIEVWDTGAGIPADRLDDIFKEFRRLEVDELRTPGMGLGLAIVDRLARLLRTHAEVRSRLGRGSVFSIELPVSRDSAVHDAGDAGRTQRGGDLLAGKTVMVLEHASSDTRSLCALLRSWGLFTLEARSVRGAVAITNAHGRLPHAVIVDDGGPGDLSGEEAVESLRARFGESIPAVILTNGRASQRLTARGYWYLDRPLRVERLRSLVNHLLGRDDLAGATLRPTPEVDRTSRLS